MAFACGFVKCKLNYYFKFMCNNYWDEIVNMEWSNFTLRFFKYNYVYINFYIEYDGLTNP